MNRGRAGARPQTRTSVDAWPTTRSDRGSGPQRESGLADRRGVPAGQQTHVQDIVDEVERDNLRDVVLAGHSYWASRWARPPSGSVTGWPAWCSPTPTCPPMVARILLDAAGPDPYGVAAAGPIPAAAGIGEQCPYRSGSGADAVERVVRGAALRARCSPPAPAVFTP